MRRAPARLRGCRGGGLAKAGDGGRRAGWTYARTVLVSSSLAVVKCPPRSHDSRRFRASSCLLPAGAVRRYEAVGTVMFGARELLPLFRRRRGTHENLCLRPDPHGVHRWVCEPRVARHVVSGRVAALVHDEERVRERGSHVEWDLGRLHVVVSPPAAGTRFATSAHHPASR